jgi:hypothetical protein
VRKEDGYPRHGGPSTSRTDKKEPKPGASRTAPAIGRRGIWFGGDTGKQMKKKRKHVGFQSSEIRTSQSGDRATTIGPRAPPQTKTLCPPTTKGSPAHIPKKRNNKKCKRTPDMYIEKLQRKSTRLLSTCQLHVNPKKI